MSEPFFNKELLGDLGAEKKTPGPKELKFLTGGKGVKEDKLEGVKALDVAPEETQQLIAAMLVNGMPLLEIANKVNIPVNRLASLRMAPEFRELLLAEMKNKGPRAVQQLIAGAMPEVVLELISLATMSQLPGKAKADICFGLMDRGFGKPVNGKPLDTDIGLEIPVDPIAESDQLDAQIESLKAKLYPGENPESEKVATS